MLSTIQRAIEAQDKVVAAARELKRSLMKHLFTYGPVPISEASHVPLKETEIGPVPDHWRYRGLGPICDDAGGVVQTGPFGSQLHASDYVAEGIPVVMPQDISSDGRVLLSDIARVRPSEAERLLRHKLRSGDIVLGRRGELGRRALITDRETGWLCGTGCLLIRAGQTELNAGYLFHYLSHPKVIERLASDAIGTTMPNLNARILRNLPIAYPSISGQERIAASVDLLDAKTCAEERRKTVLQALFKTMLRHLMTGKIRVPTTVTNDG